MLMHIGIIFKEEERKMKKILALMLSFTMIFGLVACGGGDSNTDSDSTEAKDSITIAIDADYQTLHPANWTTTIEKRIDDQIYDPLVRHDFEDDSKLVGVVAESWEIGRAHV